MKITFKVSVKLFLCKNRLKRKRGKFAGISLEISTRKKCKGNLTFYDFGKKFWTQGEASKEERVSHFKSFYLETTAFWLFQY